MDLISTVLTVGDNITRTLQCYELADMLLNFGFKSDLVEFQHTVERITAVLRDAEKKQPEELSYEAQDQIEKLKDVFYEADDLLDELATRAQQQHLMDSDATLFEKVRHFFSLSNPVCVSYSMNRGLKDFKKKLDAIVYNKQFSIEIDNDPIRKRDRETCSYLNEVIIGRGGDLEEIVGMLLDSNLKHDVSVLSIVGIGGLGKTALAQLVFNDSRVTSAFPLRVWTCVSDQDQKEFNVKEILCKILNLNYLNSSMEQVHSELRKRLDRQTYLLVLDDVWTERRDLWGDLVKYLKCGEKGSRIVVTTRSLETAGIIDDGLIYELQGLSKDDSWCLFEMSAFGSHLPNHRDDLVKIGQDIAKGCAGVPLAIKAAGSFLYGQDKSQWQSFQEIGLANIRESKNGIVPILKLSYHNLDSSLKNCFRYCALFPKDFVIKKDMLISLWMAQNFIVPFDQGQSIEAAGEEYFSILLKRCFFQDIQKDEFGEIVSCKIHDLMHDLALSVSKKESNATNIICGKFDDNVRHVSTTKVVNDSCSFSKTCIRSFYLVDLYDRDDILFIEPLVTHCKCLRALHLGKLQIQSLPDSVGKLLHLRYLNVSENERLELLPKSITKLYNLETLDLSCCWNLKALPTDLCKLNKLRVLNISECDELIKMPRGMDKLSCLSTLSNFIVGERESCSSWQEVNDGLEELKALNKLKGNLDIEIWYPENVRGAVKEGLYLKNKEHLNFIQLSFNNETGGSVDSAKATRLMEELQPHLNLKRLHVILYRGMRMPGWITLLPNLVKLELTRCRELEYLPCMGSLHHLKFISLRLLDKLEYVEEDTSSPQLAKGEELSYYPSLEVLVLKHLPKMKGWRRCHDVDDMLDDSDTSNKAQLQLLQSCFPQLKLLEIEKCPEMTYLPPCPRLEDLSLEKFNKGVWETWRKMNDDTGIPSLMDGETCSKRSLIPKLRQVECIDDMAWLKLLPMKTFKSLEYLQLRNDDEVEYLGEVEEVFRSCSSSLQRLEISRCSKLRKVICGGLAYLTALEDLSFDKCENVRLSSSSEEEDRENNGLSMLLPSLRTLTLKGLPQMENLPNWMQFLTNLQSLEIRECISLESIPNWMPKLTSLNRLDIIGNSESLKRRCQKDPPGEDWPFIQHIPTVNISDYSFTRISQGGFRVGI